MDAYRAMLRPESNSAESERLQAAKNLTDLEAKWPVPPPWEGTPKGPGAGFGGFYGFRDAEPPRPPDPEQEARRAREREQWEERKRQRAEEEDGRTMQQAIDRQRAQVTGIPFWRLDPHLVRLHEAEAAWTADEHVRFDRRRKENHGAPERDVAYVAAAIVTLGKAWGEARLGDEERGWIEGELQRIATVRTRVSALATLWIRSRIR